MSFYIKYNFKIIKKLFLLTVNITKIYLFWVENNLKPLLSQNNFIYLI
jgi:hypothetical protein